MTMTPPPMPLDMDAILTKVAECDDDEVSPDFDINEPGSLAPGTLGWYGKNAIPALVARVRELETKEAMAVATDEEVRAILAEYTAKIDAAIEKGKTNLACHWCLEVADVTDPNAIDRHYRTCPKSPLVIEIAERKAEMQRACETIAAMHAAAVGGVTGPRRGVVEDVADVREALRLTVYAIRSCHGHMEHDDWNTIRRAMGEAGGGDE